jgi:hypothetical protein
MKYFLLSLLFFVCLPTFAEVFPSSMAELYCIKHENKAETCLNITMEQAHCLNKFSIMECLELTGPNLCVRANHTPAECKSKTFNEGFCLSSGFTLEECKNATAAKLICKTAAHSFRECNGITEPEVMCMTAGRTREECKGITTAEVLCFDIRKDASFCKDVTISQIQCVKKGFSRSQMTKGCE